MKFYLSYNLKSIVCVLIADKVKDEHEKFLLSLETPMRVPKEKILRWHPEFSVESCISIEQSELPQPPNIEKMGTAKDVLSKISVINLPSNIY